MGQIVPMLDLASGHPNDPGQPRVTTPANLEAEQALLGIVLYDNTALDLIEVELEPDHFHEPFHRQLYLSMVSAIRAQLLAEPFVLYQEFRRSTALQQLGGLDYLTDLVDRAPSALNAPEYARVILEEAHRRQLVRVGELISGSARGTLVDDETGRLTPGAIIESAEKDLLEIQVSRRGRHNAEFMDMADAARAAIAYVDDRSKPVGVKWGLNPIDLQLGPMMPGDLILLAGRPSMGKSAMALSATINVSAPALADHLNEVEHDGRPPRGVMEFHGEMSFNDKDGGQVARRHLSNIGHGLYGAAFPSYKDIRDKRVSIDQRVMMDNAAGNLAGVPLRAVKRTGMKLSTIRSMARRQIAAWGRAGVDPGLIIIDHVGLIRPDGRTNGRYEAQTEIALGAKELADELGVPILALVQLSRDIERRDDKRPQLSDLRDSGAWEENADIAAFVYRDAYYAEKEPEPDQNALEWASWDQRRRSKDIDVIFGKVREGSAGGIAKVWGGLAWNAIRPAQPGNAGGLL